MSSERSLYILCRRKGGDSDAELTAGRLYQTFHKDWSVQYIAAGETVNGVLIGGESGSLIQRTKAYAKSVNALIAQSRPDLIISFESGITCDVYRAKSGVYEKGLLFSEDGWMSRVLNPWHALSRRFESISVCEATSIVASSEMVLSDFEQYYPKQRDKLDMVYNGFDLNDYHPARVGKLAVREQLQLPEEGRMVLFASNDWEHDGFEDCLRFVALADNIVKETSQKPYLVVVGEGRQDKYKSLLKKYNLQANTHFIMPVPSLVPFCQAADLLLLPTRYNPFSHRCLEALACGCPVITTANNGSAEIVKHQETGYILDDRAGDSRREAVSWWLRLRALPQQIAESVRHLSEEGEVQRYRDLFESILEDRLS